MANPVPPAPAPLVAAINSSGYPLHIAIAHAVATGSKRHGWRVLYEEHAWRSGDDAGFIDVVLEHEALQVVLLIECKQLQSREWVLLPREGNVHLTRHARALRVERRNGAVIRGFPRWSDEPCDPNMPEAMFCVMLKDQRDRSVERVAAELICATEALAHEEREYLDRRGGDSRRLYFSAIVTTAQLSVCYFDPGQASLADGMIPAKSKFTPARAVRLTKQLSTREIMDMPDSAYAQEAAALAKAKERTVFVVNAESLDGFLNAFKVDDREKSRPETPEVGQ